MCHPTAQCCVAVIIIPVVVGLYFFLGLVASMLAYGVVLAVVVAIIFCFEWLTRWAVEMLSCGRCFSLDIPRSWYLKTLIPGLGNYVGNAGRDDGARIKAQLFDDMSGAEQGGRFDPDMDPGEEGFESDVMGTPCPAVSLAVAPYPVLICAVPIVLVAVVFASCFMWEDYLTRVVVWKNGDMDWYMADHRMGPGTKAWSWWFQVFTELLSGLTDAWKHVFQMWWVFLKNTVTVNKGFADDVVSFFEHGVNPANLFRSNFQKFREGVLFWRFVLAAVFSMIRTTALINLPRSAIRDDERSFRTEPYSEEEGLEMDPFDPYRR